MTPTTPDDLPLKSAPKRWPAIVLSVLVLLALLVCLLSPQPIIHRFTGGIAISHLEQDAAHVALFGFLALFLSWARVMPRSVWATALLLGVGTEWVQQFVGRHSNLEGVAFDLVGAGAGLLCASIIHKLHDNLARR